MSIVPTIIHSDEKKNADLNIVIFHVHCGVEVLFYPNTAAASPQEIKKVRGIAMVVMYITFQSAVQPRKDVLQRDVQNTYTHARTHARTHTRTHTEYVCNHSISAGLTA